MSDKEKIKKLIKLANAIINPASEILPETYDNELSNYWDFITTLNQNKDDQNNMYNRIDNYGYSPYSWVERQRLFINNKQKQRR